VLQGDVPFDANIFIKDRDIAQKSKSKMAATAILNFDRNVILGPSDTCTANLQTKFDANCSRNRCLCTSKMAVVCLVKVFTPILDCLLRSPWWTVFPCKWRNDPFRYDWDIAISQSHRFSWKMPIQTNI